MRSRVFLIVALAALAASGWFFLSRRRAAHARATAQLADALASRLTVCVVGETSPARDVAAMNARLRRVALASTTPAVWPMNCSARARAIVEMAHGEAHLAKLSTQAAALATALDRDAILGEVTAFREGRAGLPFDAIATALRGLHVEATILAGTYGRSRERPRETNLPTALAPIGGDLIPVSIAQGAVVAGSNSVAGTLSALFIEPTRERVFCRSRDRGGSWTCRRFAREGAPQYLVGSDAPEAITLVESPAGTAAFASLDALTQPVFSLTKPIVPSLAARVSNGALVAVTADGPRAVLQRCARGGACVEAPLGTPSRLESVLVRAGSDAWWVGVSGEANALSLDARSVSAAPAPLGEVQHVTTLHSPSTLLASCNAEGVSYVAAVDAPGTHLFAVEPGHAPRELGDVAQSGLPFELLCDAQGVTLVGGSSAQSCRREGGCAPALSFEVPRRFARIGGELVMVSIARDGDGLRVRHGDPMNFATAPTAAIDDDAAHGGISARSLWLFSAGDRLALFATGATTVALWSDDRGATWQPAREGFDGAIRPARMGALR